MVSVETLRLISDIGFMATSNGLSTQAKSIFDAVELLRPDSVLPDIGKALNYLNLNQFQNALDVLEKKALKKEPDDPTVNAFIGMALMLMGRNNESEGFLKPVLNQDDKVAANLASTLLEELKSQASK